MIPECILNTCFQTTIISLISVPYLMIKIRSGGGVGGDCCGGGGGGCVGDSGGGGGRNITSHKLPEFLHPMRGTHDTADCPT